MSNLNKFASINNDLTVVIIPKQLLDIYNNLLLSTIINPIQSHNLQNIQPHQLNLNNLQNNQLNNQSHNLQNIQPHQLNLNNLQNNQLNNQLNNQYRLNQFDQYNRDNQSNRYDRFDQHSQSIHSEQYDQEYLADRFDQYQNVKHNQEFKLKQREDKHYNKDYDIQMDLSNIKHLNLSDVKHHQNLKDNNDSKLFFIDRTPQEINLKDNPSCDYCRSMHHNSIDCKSLCGTKECIDNKFYHSLSQCPLNYPCSVCKKGNHYGKECHFLCSNDR